MSRSRDFEDALGFATRLHAGQLRKGSSTPYIANLLALAAIALEHGASDKEAIAALLHDAVEDQGGKPTLKRIRRRFGKRVANIVTGCTDATESPKPPWCQRKKDFIRGLSAASPSIRLVVAADKLHNARSVLADYRTRGDAVWASFNQGRAGTLWYYRSVASALLSASQAGEQRLDDLIAELDRTVTAIELACNTPAPVDYCG